MPADKVLNRKPITRFLVGCLATKRSVRAWANRLYVLNFIPSQSKGQVCKAPKNFREKLFCVPATSTQSERIFSAARNIAGEKYCMPTTDYVNYLMFLNSKHTQ